MTWAKRQGKTVKLPSHRDRLRLEAERIYGEHRELKAAFLRRERVREKAKQR